MPSDLIRGWIPVLLRNRVYADCIYLSAAENAQVIKKTFGKSLFRPRVGVQYVLDRLSQIKQPLLYKDGHVTHIGGGFPPILKDARLPRKLTRKLIALRLIGVWRVLHFPHLLGFFAYLLGHGFLFA